MILTIPYHSTLTSLGSQWPWLPTCASRHPDNRISGSSMRSCWLQYRADVTFETHYYSIHHLHYPPVRLILLWQHPWSAHPCPVGASVLDRQKLPIHFLLPSRWYRSKVALQTPSDQLILYWTLGVGRWVAVPLAEAWTRVVSPYIGHLSTLLRWAQVANRHPRLLVSLSREGKHFCAAPAAVRHEPKSRGFKERGNG